MKLSEHFTLREFERSMVADRKGIPNTVPEDMLDDVQEFFRVLVQPIRDLVGRPVIITSGFRCGPLNEAVGGSRNSFHMLGQAVDIIAVGMNAHKLYLTIKNSGLPFDKVILEPSWVHVQWKPQPRRQAFIFDGEGFDLDEVVA